MRLVSLPIGGQAAGKEGDRRFHDARARVERGEVRWPREARARPARGQIRKGRRGEVLRVFPRAERALVQGVNIVTKHTKPRGLGQPGGIVFSLILRLFLNSSLDV